MLADRSPYLMDERRSNASNLDQSEIPDVAIRYLFEIGVRPGPTVGKSDRGEDISVLEHRHTRYVSGWTDEELLCLDDLFAAYESPSESDASQSEQSVVMVGMYYFEETDTNAKYKW